MRKKIKLLFTAAASFVSLFLATSVSANVSPPNFPSCEQKIFSEKGDWAHYDFGVHGIPGIGNFEGSDDVYTLDSGNFLQCFCPVEGSNGFQTNWWNIGVKELSQEEIDEFVAQGWHFEASGTGWNLSDDPYLVRNSEISCVEPTPTPTPTATPTPTPTPTPGPEPESRCSSLSASPVEGTAPLTVRFNGSGFDEDGEIKRYRFDFGDASGGQPQVWEQDGPEAFHRYENPGEYVTSLHVKDSRGNWRNGQESCRVEIEVNGKPKVLAAVVTQLPKTGAPISVVLGLTALSGVGAYLYKRFKIV